MATELTRIGCPICAFTHAPRRLGLTADGSHDPELRPPLFKSYVYRFAGRAQVQVSHGALPLHFAYGLRDALRTALAQLEQEIVDAGGELPE